MQHLLTTEACNILVLDLVMSHLDYTNVIFLNLQECTISHLQRVQNITAWVVLDKEQLDSITNCLKELHWLPIQARVQYKVLTQQSYYHQDLHQWQIHPGQDSSVGRAADHHATCPGFNTCSRLILAGGCSIPSWVG